MWREICARPTRCRTCFRVMPKGEPRYAENVRVGRFRQTHYWCIPCGDTQPTSLYPTPNFLSPLRVSSEVASSAERIGSVAIRTRDLSRFPMHTASRDYRLGSESCGISKGDRVKVLRKAESYERGWGNTWHTEMDGFVGGVYEVEFVRPLAGLYLKGTSFGFPYFILEKLGLEFKPKRMLRCVEHNLLRARIAKSEKEDEND